MHKFLKGCVSRRGDDAPAPSFTALNISRRRRTALQGRQPSNGATPLTRPFFLYVHLTSRSSRGRRLAAGLIGLLGLGGCGASSAAPACDKTVIRVAVGDTRWALPAALTPSLPTGSFAWGPGQRKCPLPGLQEITAENFVVQGTTSSGAVAPPLGVQVIVRRTGNPHLHIARLPALTEAAPSTIVADSTVERAGLRRADVGALRVYTPIRPDGPFAKIICGQRTR